MLYNGANEQIIMFLMNEQVIFEQIKSLINDNHKFIAHNFLGKYLDCGSMQGYIKSTQEIGKL